MRSLVKRKFVFNWMLIGSYLNLGSVFRMKRRWLFVRPLGAPDDGGERSHHPSAIHARSTASQRRINYPSAAFLWGTVGDCARARTWLMDRYLLQEPFCSGSSLPSLSVRSSLSVKNTVRLEVLRRGRRLLSGALSGADTAGRCLLRGALTEAPPGPSPALRTGAGSQSPAHGSGPGCSA